DAERRFGRQALEELKAAKPEKMAQELGLTPEARQQAADESKRLQAAPGGAIAVFDEAQRRLDAYYDRILVESRKPPWERYWEESLQNDGSLAATLLDMLV